MVEVARAWNFTVAFSLLTSIFQKFVGMTSRKKVQRYKGKNIRTSGRYRTYQRGRNFRTRSFQGKFRGRGTRRELKRRVRASSLVGDPLKSGAI
jgi:hypothetical protein